MPDIEYTVLNGVSKKLKDMGDGTYAPVFYLGGGGGSGSTTDRELVVSTYRCKTAFTGASVGDTITATQVIDVSGASPSTVSTIWRNQTTAADLASAPSAANLELTGSTALTAAQLAAAGLALDTTAAAVRDRLPTNLISGRLSVEPIPALGAARVVAAGAASASVALTATGIRAVKLTARGTDVRFAIGVSPQTATVTSHYLPMGASLTVRVGSNQVVAALSDIAGVVGSLEITELV